MTEQNPETIPGSEQESTTPLPPPQVDLTPEQVDEIADRVAERVPAAVVEGHTPKYAAYDKTFGCFLPGTHDTEAAATAAAKRAGITGRRLDVRDVSTSVKASRQV